MYCLYFLQIYEFTYMFFTVPTVYKFGLFVTLLFIIFSIICFLQEAVFEWPGQYSSYIFT